MSQSGFLDTSGGGGGNVQTLTGNSGGAVGPSGNNINILGTTGQLTVTGNPGTSTLTIALTSDQYLAYTSVTTTPYVVTATDCFLGVSTSGGIKTIQLPNAPSTGRFIVIKDATGNAATNNITVTTVGGAVNIDGAVTYTMNAAYQSISVLFNGTSYLVW